MKTGGSITVRFSEIPPPGNLQVLEQQACRAGLVNYAVFFRTAPRAFFEYAERSLPVGFRTLGERATAE